jgi:succinoglycan biosynthesis transport protein ExoP
MPQETQEMSTTVRRYLDMARRRRWWVLASTCAVSAAVALGSLLLPNRFTSEATVLVVQQQVPERYVIPNTTYSVRQALESLTEAVLSRSRLLSMVSQFDLYPRERNRLGPEGLVQLMRNDIQIDPIQKDATQKDVNAFQISFTADNAVVAQQVTEQLTTSFINENLKLQEQQDAGTTDFLKDQLAAAEQDLKDHEERLKTFRTQNLGELPEQQSGNLQILSGLHSQLQSTMTEMNRAQEQHVYLSSLLDQYQELANAGRPLPGSAGSEDPIPAAQAELERLESQRASLLAQFTPQYPDVVETNRKIEVQKRLLATLRAAKAHPEPGQQAETSSSAASGVSGSEAQLRSQLEANRLQIDDLSKSQKRLESQIAQYEQRINLTPVREQQLTDILRGYDMAKKHYDDLSANVSQSEMATSLAKRQQGQQFTLVDAASLPGRPSSPDRRKIILAGAAAGLGLGIALAFLVESWDHSFYDERELVQQFKVPIFVALPFLLTPADQSRRSRRKVLEWLGATAMVLLALAVELYVGLHA